MIKKIVIIGPESTGKSSLCEHLADHFKTIWVPEYARAFLLERGKNYTYQNLLEIARGQLELEDRYSNKLLQNIEKSGDRLGEAWSPILFIDTDMYVMKVWSEFVFGKCHDFILKQISQRKYDLYLLCKPDLPWVKDELREYPDVETRKKLYKIYRDILINQNTPWVEISGNYDERLQLAINAVVKNFS